MKKENIKLNLRNEIKMKRTIELKKKKNEKKSRI